METILIGALLVALLASLVLNILLFKQGKQYYHDLNSLRLDPIGLAYFLEPEDRNPDLPLVVFYGDSRSAGWPTPETSKFDFANRGIGAQTTEQVLERFDAHIKPLSPDVIIIQVGINDLKTLPLFPDDKRTIIANCKENIQELVTRSTDLGATVILTTIFPVGKPSLERKLFWSDEVSEAVVEVNDYLHSLAGEQVVIFDTYAILVGKDGKFVSEYSQDLLHLSEYGYQALNNELATLLANLP